MQTWEEVARNDLGEGVGVVVLIEDFGGTLDALCRWRRHKGSIDGTLDQRGRGRWSCHSCQPVQVINLQLAGSHFGPSRRRKEMELDEKLPALKIQGGVSI